MMAKTTGTIKVKVPLSKTEAKVGPVAAPAAPAAERQGSCKSCQQRSIDPIAMEIQANDKALRKIMDLEISTTSLLAVNTSLENTIRQQSQEMESMRQELERYRALAKSQTRVPVVPAPVLSSSPPVPVEDNPTDLIKEDDDVEVGFSRVCAMIQQMVEDGQQAIDYRPEALPALQVIPIDQVSHVIDIETQARKVLARKQSQGSLTRAAGALRKASSTCSSSSFLAKDVGAPSCRSPIPEPLTSPQPIAPIKASKKPASRVGSGSRPAASTESASVPEVVTPKKLRPQVTPTTDEEVKNTQRIIARRPSVIMKPLVDSPTAVYLDDPYMLLSDPPQQPPAVVDYGSRRVTPNRSSYAARTAAPAKAYPRVMARHDDDKDSMLSGC
ncbi:hypothetical protein HKX48_004969 [Thoreauomyces humboldtii]|nr:hypothetical protein HKX48_004969 [Thoreauomyces humboldtii]